MNDQILKNSVQKGLSYEAYTELVKRLVSEKKSTGPEQTASRIDFTKLNASRMRRLDKTLVIPKQAVQSFQNIKEKQTWLVILESWCADGAQTIPVLNKICEISPNLQLKIVLRDETPELMDLFLTNGTKSIPKLIILGDNNTILNIWGPRSKMATKMVEAYKSQKGVIDESFKEFLQIWYNKDMGEAIIDELVSISNASHILAS